MLVPAQGGVLRLDNGLANVETIFKRPLHVIRQSNISGEFIE